MPNGSDRNWIRLCATIDGFRLKYKRWPKKVRVFSGFAEEMQQWVLGEAGFSVLKKKITIVEDGSLFIAEDDTGRQYNYSKEGFPVEKPDKTAVDWLGISSIA